METKMIIMKQDYGKVRLTLRQRMEERGISRNALARSIGTRFEVVDKWYKNEISNLDLDVLARICYALQCDISALLEYTGP